MLRKKLKEQAVADALTRKLARTPRAAQAKTVEAILD
jgi:hypothetical protein